MFVSGLGCCLGNSGERNLVCKLKDKPSQVKGHTSTTYVALCYETEETARQVNLYHNLADLKLSSSSLSLKSHSPTLINFYNKKAQFQLL